MTLIATKESVSNIKYTYQYHSLMTFLALLLSIISVGAFSFLCIVRPEPRWNPQYVIPMCGMLMGNCISGVKLTVKHLTTQIMEGGRREIELCLSFGASGWQSIRRQVNEAVGAGVTPMVNSLNVIGLVAIPGE
jgi:putative ABC transport system permease protein